MTSPDPAIRREAIRTIGAIGTEAAFPLLTDVLSDPDREIRILAVRALAGLPADVVRHQLFELARAKEFSRRTWFEKKEIFLALASAADPEIEDWITSVVRKRRWFHREENDELRAGAVGALARLGNPTAMAIVRDALEDRSPQVRRAAAQALRPTGEH
jgi:HEAT repeat protein